MGSPHIQPGAVVEIDLEDGYFAYGRIVHDADYGIYDLYTPQRITDLNQIIQRPLLFIVAVSTYAVNSRRWVKIGKAPLSPSLQNLPLKFIQDAIHPDRFELYDPNTGMVTPALKEACRGLERCMVWGPEHVEERIRDHYAGKLTQWLKADRELFQ